MTNYILHISDTDINKDSRVLKEMRSLKNFCQENNFQIYGLGIELLDDTNYNTNIDLNIYTCKRKRGWIFFQNFHL